MNFKKIFLVLAVFLAAALICNYSYCAETPAPAAKPEAGDVKLVLTSEKADYILGEPLNLSVALINMTGLDKSLDAVRVCTKLDIDSYINISAESESGKKYNGFLGSGDDIATFHVHMPFVLKPREEKRLKFNVTNLFANKNTEGQLPIAELASAPGSYTISAGISELGIKSTPLTINIKEAPKPVKESLPAEDKKEAPEISAPAPAQQDNITGSQAANPAP